MNFEPLELRAVLSAVTAVDLSQLYAQPTLNPLASVTNPTPVGYTPAQVARAYGFSGITFSGGIKGDGSGQTIAIVDAYNDPNIVNDLHVFDQTFGIADPPNFRVVNQNGGSSLPATSAGWSEEIALDVEWAHAMAPGANILLVEANSASLSDLLASVDYARNVAGVSVVSMSWGSSEFFSESQYDRYFTTPAGHQSITFVASAGDSGAQATWPAISPNVLSVGGTSLRTSGGNYLSESAWSGSGGGFSSYISEPAYQTSVQSSGARTGPDVSYDASPSTGFAVYDTVAVNGRTGWFQIGGTSAGAPQWAALLAIANQGRALTHQDTLGGAQSLIYKLPSSDFHDVTSGSNGYAAQTGYDLVTGRGTPIASSVVRDLVGNASGTSSGSTSQSGGATSSAPQSGSTTTTYEWVYWNHRWWLIIVTSPAATIASDPGSTTSATVEFAVAVNSGISTTRATAAPFAASATIASTSAAANEAASTAQTAPTMTAPFTAGGFGVVVARDSRSPNPADDDRDEDSNAGGNEASENEKTESRKGNATSDDLPTDIVESVRSPSMLLELDVGIVASAREACFASGSLANVIDEAIKSESDFVEADGRFHTGAAALVLALAAGCTLACEPDANTAVAQRPTRFRSLRAAQSGR